MSEFTTEERTGILANFAVIPSGKLRSKVMALAENLSAEATDPQERRDIYLAALNYYTRPENKGELFRDFQQYAAGATGEWMDEGDPEAEPLSRGDSTPEQELS
jgi:hypothetical protein